MHTLIYDGTFAGLLTAVFDVYEYKYTDVTLLPHTQRQDSLFGDTHLVHTDDAKADRVWKGMKKHTSGHALADLYRTFLSEQVGMEDKLLQYMQYAFSSNKSIEKDYSHPAVLYVTDTTKKVHREKHRMEAFVRFQKTKDNIYYATVEPDFNVLPLIADHFEKRYADQQWLIYDTKRKYGIYYDLDKVNIVDIDFNETSQKQLPAGADAAPTAQSPTGDSKPRHTILDDTEILYQQLWQNYFNSVNIPSRKNIKLHVRHMPHRYWKYLTEKQPRIGG